MPFSEVDVASRDLKSQFLDGLARPALKTILAGAIQGWVAQRQRRNQPQMACSYGNN